MIMELSPSRIWNAFIGIVVRDFVGKTLLRCDDTENWKVNEKQVVVVVVDVLVDCILLQDMCKNIEFHIRGQRLDSSKQLHCLFDQFMNY